IDSILGQRVEDLELIVVDDGSTDATPDIASGTGDPRVRHLPLPHMGISMSLNRGFAEARADYVAVLDADDWALPDRLERQLEVLESRPEVAVVGCWMDEVDAQGTRLKPRFGRRMADATGDVTELIMRFNPIPNTSAAMRRSAVLDVRGYDPRYKYAMEYDLWLRLAESHRIWNLSEVLAVREMGGSNVAVRNDRDQVGETVRMKLAAIRRRRSAAGADGLIHPVLSYVMPLPLKRALRRARGMAR
ncbi:MAG: glycosyltransferase, partial [Thermoleophilaceae bacterium]|nr:glycosyltransferase [Thermoleophilaceae bacterium]